MQQPGWKYTCRSQLLARASATSSPIDVPQTPHSSGRGTGKTALNHPTAVEENRHSNTHSSARRNISSFLGRKQGLAFVGLYSIWENKHKRTRGQWGLLFEFCYLLSPQQNKAHQTSSIAVHPGQEAVVPPLDSPTNTYALRELH